LREKFFLRTQKYPNLSQQPKGGNIYLILTEFTILRTGGGEKAYAFFGGAEKIDRTAKKAEPLFLMGNTLISR